MVKLHIQCPQEAGWKQTLKSEDAKCQWVIIILPILLHAQA